MKSKLADTVEKGKKKNYGFYHKDSYFHAITGEEDL